MNVHLDFHSSWPPFSLVLDVFLTPNPGKDFKYGVMWESWELGFAPLYQPFVDS